MTALCLVFFLSAELGSAFDVQRRRGMCPYFEDDEDPKRPRPVSFEKKRTGAAERGEARKDYDRDHHRHVQL